MRRKVQTAIVSVVIFLFLFVSLSIHFSHELHIVKEVRLSIPHPQTFNPLQLNLLVKEPEEAGGPHPSKVPARPDSILFPDWEVFVVLPRAPAVLDPNGGYTCVFQNGATYAARYAGLLTSSGAATFKCRMPFSARRLRPFFTPVVTHPSDTGQIQPETDESRRIEMLRWNFFVYESISTEDDVVVFAKGVNNRQGVNRNESDLHCVFADGVKTAVTSSSQEVFRCSHPDHPVARGSWISLEIGDSSGWKRVVPSVAAYEPKPHTLAEPQGTSLLCACTVVHGISKFLKEWVLYHAQIGVDRFILYDNGSEDHVASVVNYLLEAGYHVIRMSWPWPKTQEAAFSHSATTFKTSCTWIMYVDVDEFVFSPSWKNQSQPSKLMLQNLLPPPNASSSIGQVSIRCLEFGPSNLRSHPKEGVTQGYTCRRQVEQRHKSIVLSEAVDRSLLNMIHHFKLKEGWETVWLSLQQAVVNHYKYQAWSEFKHKFKRRVSAYVFDWREAVNLASKDRPPGLGHDAVEPKGWESMFCEVNDTQLKDVSRRWFGLEDPKGYKMAWQD